MNTRNTAKRPNRFTRTKERMPKRNFMARQAADIAARYVAMNANLPKKN